MSQKLPVKKRRAITTADFKCQFFFLFCASVRVALKRMKGENPFERRDYLLGTGYAAALLLHLGYCFPSFYSAPSRSRAQRRR